MFFNLELTLKSSCSHLALGVPERDVLEALYLNGRALLLQDGTDKLKLALENIETK